MHRGGRGYENGKGGGKAFERGGGKDWRSDRDAPLPPPPPQQRDGGRGRGGRGGYRDHDDNDEWREPARQSGQGGEMAQAVVSRLEKRLDSVQKEFLQALHTKSQKENDKFDLIFGILSELQSRQAVLEDLVQNLVTQHPGNGMGGGMASGMGMGSSNMSPQFGTTSGGTTHYSQQSSHQLNGGMGVQQQFMQQPMQQHCVMMNADGSQSMVAMQPMQQVVVVSSPTNSMGSTMVPQMQMQQGALNAQMQEAGSSSQEQLPASASEQPEPQPASEDLPVAQGDSEEPAAGQASQEPAASSGSKMWEKNRKWQAVNIPEGDFVPVVAVSEPYGPGIDREPSDDIVLKRLKNGDIVRQTGHSKKTRNYMVMPVLVEADGEHEEVEGFVTRRSMDKSREDGDLVWFEEVINENTKDKGDREERRDRWKPGRATKDS